MPRKQKPTTTTTSPSKPIAEVTENEDGTVNIVFDHEELAAWQKQQDAVARQAWDILRKIGIVDCDYDDV